MTLPTHNLNVWQPASQEDKIKALVLLGALPSSQAGNIAVDKAAYYLSLDGVTRHGLMEAVKAILQGKLGHAFFPNPPELRMQCDIAMQWHVRERERIHRREQMERDKPAARQPLPLDAKLRQEERMRRFHADLATSQAAEKEAAERAEVRERYGMTEEMIAGLRDRPVQKSWEQVGSAVRGVV